MLYSKGALSEPMQAAGFADSYVALTTLEDILPVPIITHLAAERTLT